MLPDSLVALVKGRGVMIRVGNTNVIEMGMFADAPEYQLDAPRGRSNEKWTNVGGAYDSQNGIVYIGNMPHGSTSTA